MDVRDLSPFDWYSNLFGKRGSSSARFFESIFKEFEDMRREISKSLFEQFKIAENTVPKSLIKEYNTSEGGKVRELGPIVYGYSMTIGPDGIPKIREFGNVKSPYSGRELNYQQPSISAEREPLVDVSSTDKEIKVVAEMPGIKKENIKINAYETSVEISSNDEQRKYRKVIDLPPEVDIETAKSTYNNGILEVIFNKKIQTKPKGKEVKVE